MNTSPKKHTQRSSHSASPRAQSPTGSRYASTVHTKSFTINSYVKEREARYYASKVQHAPASTPALPGVPPSIDFNAILRAINPQAGQQQAQLPLQQFSQPQTFQQSQPQTSTLSALEKTFAMFAQPPAQQQQSQPQQPSNPLAGVDLAAILAAVNKPQQQQQQQQPMQSPASMHVPNFQQPPASLTSANQQPLGGGGLDLQQILAQFAPQNQPAQQGFGGYGSGNQQQQWGDGGPEGGFDKKNKGKAKKKGGWDPNYVSKERFLPLGSNDGVKHLVPKAKLMKIVIQDNKYTRTCTFWLEGKCRKGSECTFRHDNEAGP